MNRRKFIYGLANAVASVQALGAQSSTMARVAVLWPAASTPQPPRMESFSQGLRGSGYTQGSNLSIDIYPSEKGMQPLRDLALEAINNGCSVIASFGDLATRAAQEATKTVPIVATPDDVLGSQLVPSLSHPGGNTTGLTLLSTDMVVKRLEALKQIAPSLSHVAGFWDPSAGVLQVKAAQEAATLLGVKLRIVELRSRDDLDRVLQFEIGNAEGLYLFSSPFLASLHRPIVEFSASRHLPTVYQWKEHVVAGGLMSYGLSLSAVGDTRLSWSPKC